MATPLFQVPMIAEGRFIGLILDILIFILVLYYTSGDKKIYIRRVAGLDAIEEATAFKRLMDEFDIASEVGQGTTITMKKWRR